nr:probable WRKY transcription factor 31 [Ipomoea batatas]
MPLPYESLNLYENQLRRSGELYCGSYVVLIGEYTISTSSNEAELERMSVENQVLRDMLSQVSDKYSNLQTQMISLMQHQKDNHHHHGKVDEEDNRNNWEGGGGEFPTKFMDHGLATARSNDGAVDEANLSSSPEGQSRGETVPRLGHGSESSSVDKATKATMTKAHVFVRARVSGGRLPSDCDKNGNKTE